MGEEAREAAVGETSSRATTAGTSKRGLENVGCGEEAELVGKEALTVKVLGECEGSAARRGGGEVAARGEGWVGE